MLSILLLGATGLGDAPWSCNALFFLLFQKVTRPEPGACRASGRGPAQREFGDEAGAAVSGGFRHGVEAAQDATGKRHIDPFDGIVEQGRSTETTP